MRLETNKRIYLIDETDKYFHDADLYLFGSRVDDNARGGDIDLLLLSDTKIDSKKIREFKIDFYKRYGWQKLDLVNFTRDSNDTFKAIALSDAVLLRRGGGEESVKGKG